MSTLSNSNKGLSSSSLSFSCQLDSAKGFFFFSPPQPADARPHPLKPSNHESTFVGITKLQFLDMSGRDLLSNEIHRWFICCFHVYVQKWSQEVPCMRALRTLKPCERKSGQTLCRSSSWLSSERETFLSRQNRNNLISSRKTIF